jgi:hypothetical protein
VRRTHLLCSSNIHTYLFCDLLLFTNYSGTVEPQCKQHPSNSAHLVRRFVRGLSIHIYQFFILNDFCELDSRRVGRMWLAQAYAQQWRDEINQFPFFSLQLHSFFFCGCSFASILSILCIFNCYRGCSQANCRNVFGVVPCTR